ncbi:MAG: Gfo/Idh/MocA family oxidoreductase [Planctomycetaceae bacterium]|jgi:predicted dehydrogenase|nr:Gfo/Idh/MocA family oxidoreductase [Planctomycetaceae bacterium]
MTKISRRSFLQTSALTTIALPMIVPKTVLGRDGDIPPSERITMGLIGCGSHGAGWNLPLMLNNPLQQVIAVCDADKNYLNNTQKTVNDFYSKKSDKTYHGCDKYEDFRDLINRKDIDAVDIVTPDHWHVLLSVYAMKAGKDVICEKPTLTIKEGRILSDLQKATQRVYQTASENRSIDVYQQMVNLARNGHLGEIRRVKVILPKGSTTNRDPMKRETNFSVTEIPKHIDYEKWSGPAPVLPFIPARHHYNWRWNFAYSGGVLTDWGSHLVNIAQWALNTDETGPVEVQAKEWFMPSFDDVWNTAETFNIEYKYKNGIVLEVFTENPSTEAVKIEGTQGWVLSRGWRQPLRASDDKLLQIKFDNSTPTNTNYGRSESTVSAKARRGWAGGEHIDFSLCVKSRKPCYYTAECGHRNHTIAHIGNISMLLGGAKLNWNPDKETFEGDRAEEANKHFCTERDQREPWTFEKVDSWINVG